MDSNVDMAKDTDKICKLHWDRQNRQSLCGQRWRKKVSVEFQRRRCVPQNCACVPSPAAPMVVSCVAGLKPGMVATIIPGVPWVQDKNIVVVTGHMYSTSHAIITKLAVTCTGCLRGNEKFTSNLMVFEQNMYENEIKEIQFLSWTLCQIPFDTLFIKLPEPQTSKYFHLSHCCLHSNIPSTYITTMAKLMRAFIHKAFYRDLRNMYFFSFPSISRTLHSIKKVHKNSLISVAKKALRVRRTACTSMEWYTKSYIFKRWKFATL